MFVGFGLRSAQLRRAGLRRAFYVPILVRPPVRAKRSFGQGERTMMYKKKIKEKSGQAIWHGSGS
jgi:hypothetical protein